MAKMKALLNLNSIGQELIGQKLYKETKSVFLFLKALFSYVSKNFQNPVKSHRLLEKDNAIVRPVFFFKCLICDIQI